MDIDTVENVVGKLMTIEQVTFTFLRDWQEKQINASRLP